MKARRDEIARLERRISETEDELRARPASSTTASSSSRNATRSCSEVRARLEKAAEQQRIQLERVAGMTSSEAREQLVAALIDGAQARSPWRRSARSNRSPAKKGRSARGRS